MIKYEELNKLKGCKFVKVKQIINEKSNIYTKFTYIYGVISINLKSSNIKKEGLNVMIKFLCQNSNEITHNAIPVYKNYIEKPFCMKPLTESIIIHKGVVQGGYYHLSTISDISVFDNITDMMIDEKETCDKLNNTKCYHYHMYNKCKNLLNLKDILELSDSNIPYFQNALFKLHDRLRNDCEMSPATAMRTIYNTYSGTPHHVEVDRIIRDCGFLYTEQELKLLELNLDDLFDTLDWFMFEDSWIKP